MLKWLEADFIKTQTVTQWVINQSEKTPPFVTEYVLGQQIRQWSGFIHRFDLNA